MNITFEPIADSVDLIQVRQLAEEIWPPTYRTILSQAQIDYMMEMMYGKEVMLAEFQEGMAFVLIKVNGKAAGYISYGPAHDPGVLKLHKLYLSQSLQGQGIGSAALQYMIRTAREQQYRQLILNVNKNNTAALKAYRRNGLQEIEKVQVDIGDGFIMDDYVMGINL